MRNLTHIKHFRQQLGNLHRCSTDQCRAARIAHLLNFVDNGCIFLARCLIQAVVHILALHRSVRRNLNHIELVDIPELSCFGRGCTGHTGQLMIHSEVVLQGNRCKSLGCSLNLHVFLCLDSLMQAIAPAAAFHDTASLLIDNLNLSVDNDILIILIKHCICLEQLLQRVYTLALNGIMSHEFVFLVYALLIGKVL